MADKKVKVMYVEVPSVDIDPDYYADEVDVIEKMVETKYKNGYELLNVVGGDRYNLFIFREL